MFPAKIMRDNMSVDMTIFALRLSALTSRITLPFPEWRLHFDFDKMYLQIKCYGECNVTGEPMDWSGRKWTISVHMTDGEIVQTIFKACLTAIEHEIREKFKYRGVSIFDPHYDIEKLVELRRQPDSIKEREHV